MPTLAPRLSALLPKVPVKIDLTWLKGRVADEGLSSATPPDAGFQESATQALLIRQVLEMNARVSAEYLAEFSVSELRAYRDRLTIAEATGPDSRWVRPENTRAVTARSAR